MDAASQPAVYIRKFSLCCCWHWEVQSLFWVWGGLSEWVTHDTRLLCSILLTCVSSCFHCWSVSTDCFAVPCWSVSADCFAALCWSVSVLFSSCCTIMELIKINYLNDMNGEKFIQVLKVFYCVCKEEYKLEKGKPCRPLTIFLKCCNPLL